MSVHRKTRNYIIAVVVIAIGLGLLLLVVGMQKHSPQSTSAMDESRVLHEFVKKQVGEGYELIDGTVTQKGIMENVVTKQETDCTDAFVGNVYTYLREKDGKKTYKTVVDVYTVTEEKTGASSSVRVLMNNFLRYYDPINAELWTRDQLNEEWEFEKELTAFFMDGLEVFGKQLKSDKKYMRILACFSADENKDEFIKEPVYEIIYRQEVGKVWHTESIGKAIFIFLIKCICVC